MATIYNLVYKIYYEYVCFLFYSLWLHLFSIIILYKLKIVVYILYYYLYVIYCTVSIIGAI